MLLLLLLFTAMVRQGTGSSEQNTQVCNLRFATCSSNEDRGRPVCGSDNLTYQNRCQLLRAQCLGVKVTLQHRGRCKGCGQHARFIFNRQIVGIFKSEYASTTTGEQPQTADSVVLEWKFSSMDKDGDGFLVKAEYRDLRRLVKKAVKPKRCAKTFTRLCDLNEDERISRDEWSACLILDLNLMQETTTTFSQQISPLDYDTSQENGEESEVNDCYSDRKAVLEEQLTSNSELYVPECTSDGRYQKIQCYRSTGYCWCVYEENGKPIPGTPVKDQVPKCSSLVIPSQSITGCPEPYRQNFIRELMNVMKKTMAVSTNTTDIKSPELPLKDSRQLTPEMQIATWNFFMLDKNRNKVLEKKEWKSFRSLVTSKPQLRRCGKRLPRYCDVNQDRKITLTEWLNCLSMQSNNSIAEPPGNESGRKGQNPLQKYLIGED